MTSASSSSSTTVPSITQLKTPLSIEVLVCASNNVNNDFGARVAGFSMPFNGLLVLSSPPDNSVDDEVGIPFLELQGPWAFLRSWIGR